MLLGQWQDFAAVGFAGSVARLCCGWLSKFTCQVVQLDAFVNKSRLFHVRFLKISALLNSSILQLIFVTFSQREVHLRKNLQRLLCQEKRRLHHII